MLVLLSALRVMTRVVESMNNLFLYEQIDTNGSAAAVEVSYTLKRWTGRTPRTLPSSQLGKQVGWKELPESRLRMDQVNRTIVVKLEAGEALPVDQCRPADGSKLM